MLCGRLFARVGGLVVAGGVALACAESINDAPDDNYLAAVPETSDAGTMPAHYDASPAAYDAGASSAKDSGNPNPDTGTPDAAMDLDSAIDLPNTGPTADMCDTSGLNGVIYAGKVLGNPGITTDCPCATSECCYYSPAFPGMPPLGCLAK